MSADPRMASCIEHGLSGVVFNVTDAYDEPKDDEPDQAHQRVFVVRQLDLLMP